MKLKSFTKKGYYCGKRVQAVVFKSYGNKIAGELQSPALEDLDGYIIHSCYTVTLDPREQLQILLDQVKLIRLESFRLFDENGEPYELD